MAENKEGQEKSEQASAKRLQEARLRGQVAKSIDVTTAAVMLFGGLMVFMLGGDMITSVRHLLRQMLLDSATIQITDQNVNHYYAAIIFFLGKILVPILLSVFVIAFTAEVSQVGLTFATKKFSEGMNLGHIFNPFGGIKKMLFSSRSAFELLKSIMKLLIIGTVVYQVLNSRYMEILHLAERPYMEIGHFLVSVCMELFLKVGIMYIIIAVGDYLFQRHKFKEDMKMTKQEVKEEGKQAEGDPRIKSRFRSIMRSRIRKLMLQNVKQADVVITNPTHYAVALKYEQGKANAPIVVAKGAELIAFQIRDIAKANDIPIVEQPPLARAIFFTVEVEQEIPENLFKAVAQVLAYVYNLKKNKFF